MKRRNRGAPKSRTGKRPKFAPPGRLEYSSFALLPQSCAVLSRSAEPGEVVSRQRKTKRVSRTWIVCPSVTEETGSYQVTQTAWADSGVRRGNSGNNNTSRDQRALEGPKFCM